MRAFVVDAKRVSCLTFGSLPKKVLILFRAKRGSKVGQVKARFRFAEPLDAESRGAPTQVFKGDGDVADGAR